MAIFNREDARTVLPQIEAKLEEVIDRIYPVGTYYTTSDHKFNPNEWGGLWTIDDTGVSHIIWHRIK